ncbi:MAG: chemotaxis protein CheD [Candidatus Heimdallarchaeota archaeon]|nr:chemotaxis protein CheD [Candidatus Heimdallarchaeota archaeon]
MVRYSIDLGTMKMIASPDYATAKGVGTCVIISMYDPDCDYLAVSHVSLPTLTNGSFKLGKYADKAVDAMHWALTEMGAQNIEAKIAGGGRVIRNSNTPIRHAGVLNVEKVEDELKEYQIPVVAKDILGDYTRSIIIDPMSKSMEITRYLRIEDTGEYIKDKITL